MLDCSKWRRARQGGEGGPKYSSPVKIRHCLSLSNGALKIVKDHFPQWEDDLAEAVRVLGKPRFVTSRSVLMNNALIDRFVDKRDRRGQELGRTALIACGNCRTELLDRSAELTAVASVDRVAFCGLTDAFFCRFMIRHFLNSVSSF